MIDYRQCTLSNFLDLYYGPQLSLFTNLSLKKVGEDPMELNKESVLKELDNGFLDSTHHKTMEMLL